MSEYLPEGKLILTQDNINTLHSFSLLSDAKKEGKILEARACVCDAEHNLIVDLGIMKGIIPREEGAIGIREGTVRDIAVISRVNRPVCFIITDFAVDENGERFAVLSREKAQQRCMKNYISHLVCGDVIDRKSVV